MDAKSATWFHPWCLNRREKWGSQRQRRRRKRKKSKRHEAVKRREDERQFLSDLGPTRTKRSTSYVMASFLLGLLSRVCLCLGGTQKFSVAGSSGTWVRTESLSRLLSERGNTKRRGAKQVRTRQVVETRQAIRQARRCKVRQQRQEAREIGRSSIPTA